MFIFLTTGDELYKAISDTYKESNINLATKEVLKYREALWAGFKELQVNQKIDANLIKQIFNQIKETTSGYRPPQAQVVVKKGEKVNFVPEKLLEKPQGRH